MNNHRRSQEQGLCDIDEQSKSSSNKDTLDQSKYEVFQNLQLELSKVLEISKRQKEEFEVQVSLYRRQERLWKRERRILKEQVRELESVVFEQAKSAKDREKYHMRERSALLEEIQWLRRPVQAKTNTGVVNPPNLRKPIKSNGIKRDKCQDPVSRFVEFLNEESRRKKRKPDVVKVEENSTSVDFQSPKSITRLFSSLQLDQKNKNDSIHKAFDNIDKDSKTILQLPLTMRHHLDQRKAKSSTNVIRSKVLSNRNKPKKNDLSNNVSLLDQINATIPTFVSKALSGLDAEKSVCSSTCTTVLSRNSSFYGLEDANDDY